MLDDDVKNVNKLKDEILRLTDNGTKREKWKPEEKILCNFQVNFINSHVDKCSICAKSMESYKNNFGIALTPPCKSFTEQMKKHIESCPICNTVNKKWNDDSIPITNEMRKGVETLSKLKKMVGL